LSTISDDLIKVIKKCLGYVRVTTFLMRPEPPRSRAGGGPVN
jgi:hypothetical protein